nr:putative GH32 family protein [Heterodera schachtii]
MAKKHTIVLTVVGVCIVVAVIAWGIIRLIIYVIGKTKKSRFYSSQLGGSNTSGIVTVPVQLYSSSILHIWLKTRSAAQEVPARIRLRHPAMDNVTLAKTDQFIEYEFHELALLLEGPANLEWAKEGGFQSKEGAKDHLKNYFLLPIDRRRNPCLSTSEPVRALLVFCCFFRDVEIKFYLSFSVKNFWHFLSINLIFKFKSDTRVSYIYVFEPDTVLERGIRPAFISNTARFPDVREGYHFRPPLGWMNDPNGFSKFGDHFHLFYQHYPHALHWSAMYWGHAVSRDLINWVHQPIFLLPDPAVALEHDGIGGIYSGSAVVVIDAVSGRPKMNVYYTDSLNGILMPDYVYQESGCMTDLNHTAMTNWRFLNVLHRDSRVNTSVVECAALLPLPAPVGSRTSSTVPLWVLLYGQLDAFDPRTGRRNMSPAFVGTFDGRQFRALFEQGFYEQSLDQTLMIGWLANWRDYDAETKSDFPTSMTVPRQMLLTRDGTTETAPGVLIAPEGLEILPGKSHSTPQRLIALGARPTEVHILLDTGSIEVFADGGRWAGEFFGTRSLSLSNFRFFLLSSFLSA